MDRLGGRPWPQAPRHTREAPPRRHPVPASARSGKGGCLPHFATVSGRYKTAFVSGFHKAAVLSPPDLRFSGFHATIQTVPLQGGPMSVLIGGVRIEGRTALAPCLTLCHPMDYSMPDFPVHHQLPELAQIHVHQVSDVIQPSHPLLSPSPPAFNLSQHQCLFQ